MPGENNGEVVVENRKYPRSRFRLGMKLAPIEPGNLPRPVKSLAADVGAGGMSIRCERAFAPGQLLTVRLYLPALDYNHPPVEPPVCPEAECTAITILGRVVWCRGEGAGQYKLGLAFLDIERRRRKLLKHFLVEYDLDEEPAATPTE